MSFRNDTETLYRSAMLRIAATAALLLFPMRTGDAQNLPMRSMRPPWAEDVAPVELNPPRNLQVMAGPFKPGQPWSASLNYPSDKPCQAGALHQRWCRRVLLTLASGSPSEMNREVWRLRSRIAGEGQPSGFAYKPKPPMDGYTEAWEEVSSDPPQIMPFPIASMIYIRTEADGRPREFVRCVTAFNAPTAEPTCDVQTTLDGTPSVQVRIVYSSQHWSERDNIRAAVMELVNSWR